MVGSLSKKTCYSYTEKKYSCDSGLTNSCLSSGNCDSSDYCEYRFKFDKTQFERYEDYGNDYFSKNKIQICKNFLNVGLKSTKCDDVLYEDYDSKNGVCICRNKIKVSNEINYTSNYSSIPNKNVTLSKYLCSNEVSCDGVNFTVSGLCTKVN